MGRDDRELFLARWGMPSPVFSLKGKKTDPGVTNIRNGKSPHWRRWLEPESRCLVPFTNFSENELTPGGSRQPIWFALDEDRPLAFFAGIDLVQCDVLYQTSAAFAARLALRAASSLSCSALRSATCSA